MIVFVTSYGHEHTVASLVTQRFGVPVPDTKVMLYDKLLHIDALPRATYIFADIERLYPWERRLAGLYYQQLSSAGLRCLNDPATVKTRFPLIRALAAAGINGYNAYRADEDPRPARFPVFLRFEHEHTGPLSLLIHDQDDLDLQLGRLTDLGISPEGVLVVEFQAERMAPGIWGRYASFRIGQTISAFGVLVSDVWYVKNGDLPTGELGAKAERFVRQNADVPTVSKAFALGRIEYGRADFGILQGGEVVFEINTNPHLEALSFDGGQGPDLRLTSRQRLADALFAIDSPGGDRVPIDPGPEILAHRKRNPIGQPSKRP